MAENKLFKVYEGLPNWARGVVVIGGVAIAYTIGNTIYKRLQRLKSDAEEQQKLIQVQIEIDKNKKNGVQPSYNDVQFNNLADAAQNAFTNCRLSIIPCPTYLPLCQSNSYKEFYPIVEQLKNDADFLQLQKIFGVRTISKQIYCGGDIRMNLATLVKDQLNNFEIEGLNRILKGNSITYRF